MSLLPVEQALERVLAGTQPIAAERVSIHEAGGRVLAAPLRALRRQPPFAASAMDGYAVRSAELQAGIKQLKVIGMAAAGHPWTGHVGPRECVRIFTGAPLPAGSDAVLLQEDAVQFGRDLIEARAAVARDRHVRRTGLDFDQGDVVLEAGRLLDPAALALAAAAGHAELDVVGRPLVAIIATGDELVAPGEEPGPGQIVASNNFAVAAIASRWGARILDLGIVRDQREAIANAVGGARQADASVIVTLGGASVGDHDLVQGVLLDAGLSLDFWRIAMRPGKPLMHGRFGPVHALGLPGNPVSAIVCAHLFLAPLVARLGGRHYAPDLRSGVLALPMKANDHRRDYVRAFARRVDGRLEVAPFETQDSSMLSLMAKANVLLIREANAPAAEAGEQCTVMVLRELD